jgi:hypothetical protein
MKKATNHAALRAKMRRLSIAELEFIRRDAHEAAQAMPDGPNAGHYADEAGYAAMELTGRLTLCNCSQCGRAYKLPLPTAREFGRLGPCSPCLDRQHVEFMRTTGARLGLQD